MRRASAAAATLEDDEGFGERDHGPLRTPAVDLATPRSQRRSLTGAADSEYPELKQNECKWPIGDPLDRAFFFCGAPTSGDNYCTAHDRRSRTSKGV